MCVIAWAWRAHPRWPLVALANRDERHARASTPLAWWPDSPDVLAGRDCEAGGTWLGVNRAGRFAAVTNRPGSKPPGVPSRGDLAAGFLAGAMGAKESAAAIAPEAERYAGFNLLLGDGERLAFVSNREPDRALEPGIHGMANGVLDEAILKVARLKAWLKAALNDCLPTPADVPPDAWLAPLADTEPARSDRPASAIFVRGPNYGTRSSSIVAFGAEGTIRFIERRFDAAGRALGTSDFSFERAP
jgi:uncharacterized protein with NRDE domain